MDMKSLIAKMDQLSQVDEAKPDFLDIDKDGDKKEPMKKAAKEKDEDKEEKKVEEAIAIQADGQEAMALLDMLKLAGQPAPQQGPEMTVTGCGMSEADRDPSYANTPDEEVADMSAATPSGTDMHREKEGWRAAAGADNPMVAAMEGKLRKMFESLSYEIPEFDPDKMSKKEKKNHMKNVPRWGDDEPKKTTKKKSKAVDIPRWG